MQVMYTVNIAIVEDEQRKIDKYKEHLARLTDETGVNFVVSEYTDSMNFLMNFASRYDIILLDIEMPYANGMEVAERVRKVDQTVTLIFITNMPQYALKGYAVRAMDYILKPVNYYTFSSAIKKVLRHLSKDSDSVVAIKTVNGIYRLYLSQIIYVESSGHKSIYHTPDKEIEVYSSMKGVDEKLASNMFCMCSSSFLINLMHVDTVDKDGVHVGDKVFTLSRSKKKEFLSKLSDYYGGL